MSLRGGVTISVTGDETDLRRATVEVERSLTRLESANLLAGDSYEVMARRGYVATAMWERQQQALGGLNTSIRRLVARDNLKGVEDLSEGLGELAGKGRTDGGRRPVRDLADDVDRLTEALERLRRADGRNASGPRPRMAFGGYVGRRGEAGRDEVPMDLPLGSIVLNRYQQAALGLAQGGTVRTVLGRGEYVAGPEQRATFERLALTRGYNGLDGLF